MTMNSSGAFSFAVLLVLFGCSLNQITLPPANPNANLANTVPVSNTVMKKMEGIYRLIGGNESLGSQFVCKTSKFRVSFFSEKDGIFIILKYGHNPVNNSIQFSGFWRHTETTDQGLINFSVASNEGASDLLQNGIASSLILSGNFKDQNGSPHELTLQFAKEFSQFAKSNEFMIFGHHGVLTTSNPPYAENSLNGALHDEDYGVNGIEFDVRLTKDNVPICVHDPSINIRLTLKGPLSGAYSQYSFPFLQDFVELVDGQSIPSVDEVLHAVVDSTTLKYVWLDIKGNPGIFEYLEPVVRNAYLRAAAQNRNIVIFAGLPSDEVIDEYKAQPTYATLPTLCELSIQCAQENGSKFFGPRYSEGLLLDDVDKAHSLGIKVISWTLNDKKIIRNYLENGRFDGFITDYPAYVVYDFYTMY